MTSDDVPIPERIDPGCEAGGEILLSFAIPCYNAAGYMDNCVESILSGSRESLDLIEIIIVNDGSTADDTGAKADAWQERHPGIIRAVHQSNGGHGEAVNTGLRNAKGKYFKVVDADDWLNEDALERTLEKLKWLAPSNLDLLVTNYVYEKPDAGRSKTITYTSVMPEDRIFGWGELGRFKPQQNLLMHAVIYRTELLRSIDLRLPSHTFYVDNIFVYVPLPAVTTIFYLNTDLYRYYIGREGQSVNEQTMIKRIEQQLLITKIMIDTFNLNTDVGILNLRKYMIHYLTMMMTICSVFLRMSERPDAESLRADIWAYLKEKDPGVYPTIRGGALGLVVNLPGKGGRSLAISGYHLAQRLFSFN